MVGHYLLTLKPEQENRALTERMAGFRDDILDGRSRCLVMVVNGIAADGLGLSNFVRSYAWPADSIRCNDFALWVTTRYDNLCKRFGEVRVNAAIRNRILSNIARRELSSVRAMSLR